jgi:hypothetical protein
LNYWQEFWKEHFLDVFLGALILVFAGLAMWCAHIHFDKGFEVFSGVACSTIVGALIGRMKTSPDPSVPALMQMIANGQPPKPPSAEKLPND